MTTCNGVTPAGIRFSVRSRQEVPVTCKHQTSLTSICQKGQVEQETIKEVFISQVLHFLCSRIHNTMTGSSSYLAKPGQVTRKWYVIDAADRSLGRLAAVISRILTGKNKPTYTPHVDTGDYVIVINAEKVKLTGKKASQSTWHYHTGHPGGYRATPWGTLLKTKPEALFHHVVKGMLPRNRLKYVSKLKVYAGPSHPHEAQNPETLDI